MKALLDSIPFNSMVPDNELVANGFCLADEGNVYLAYLPAGGDLRIDLSAVEGIKRPAGHRDYADATVAAEWMDIISLERSTTTIRQTGSAPSWGIRWETRRKRVSLSSIKGVWILNGAQAAL